MEIWKRFCEPNSIEIHYLEIFTFSLKYFCDSQKKNTYVFIPALLVERVKGNNAELLPVFHSFNLFIILRNTFILLCSFFYVFSFLQFSSRWVSTILPFSLSCRVFTSELKTQKEWQKDSRRMGLQTDGRRIAEGQIFLRKHYLNIVRFLS